MDRKQEFIINALFVATIFGLIYLGINYILPIVFPFILGFLFAIMAKALSKRLFTKDSKLKKAASLILIYLLVIAIVVVLIITGVDRLIVFVSNLPNIYKVSIAPYISQFQKVLMNLNASLPANIANVLSDTITSVFQALNTAITTIAGFLVSATTVVIKGAPNVFISIVLTVVSSFYILLDYETIAVWLIRTLPFSWIKTMGEIGDFCRNVLLKILGCYAAILGITFVELFIGFTIFGISNGPLWAFLIALLDILPVLGVGAVLIPWSVISIVIGQLGMGIEIALLYVVITVVRNAVEPKLVGGNLGLHPLVTLISMIVGLNIFGAIGMFGFPLSLSFFSHKFKGSE